jgi:dipeptidyl aminopeptidase/acylaminoacyl peptidase
MRLSFLVIAVLGVACLVGCRNGTSGLAQKTDDYAKLRETFKTQLVQHGPSPQPGEPISAPPGAALVEYTSGGHKLTAFVDAAPEGGAKRPAVLFLHGGFAFGEGDWEMAQPFRDAGYIVMTPILRGENGQPGNFTLFYDEVDDVLGAYEALAQMPQVDSLRIYVAGHSAGGTLAALAAMSTPKFRAAASLSGSLDMQTLSEMQPDLCVFAISDRRELEMRSPLVYAASFKCPVRLFYGSEEDWARGESQQTASFAKAHGLDVESVEVRGDHFTSVPEAAQKAVAFFEQH